MDVFFRTTYRSARAASWRGQYSPSPERRSFERSSDNNKMNTRDRLGSRSPTNNYFLDSLDSSVRPSRYSDNSDSFSEDSMSIGHRSMDLTDSLEFSSSSFDTPRGSSPTAGVSTFLFKAEGTSAILMGKNKPSGCFHTEIHFRGSSLDVSSKLFVLLFIILGIPRC